MDEQYDEQYDEQQQQDGGGANKQLDGAFPRINGGMLQSERFAGKIVSLVGNIVSHDTMKTADGSEVRVDSGALQDSDGLMVDPNLSVEIMGCPTGPTEIQAYVIRELGTDMDLSLYNKMIEMQQQDKYAQYFSPKE
mmetsp:Transcript_21485/g.48372  ORF Transcript_21485/g.48372 Transcript_21485/m.48372 type:complete len:137 (+) Transcript_21485:537-947(+)